jgi:hypothetical protein
MDYPARQASPRRRERIMLKREWTGIFACALAALCASAAQANELQAVRTTDKATVYIDRETVKQTSGKSTVWSIWDHKSDQTNMMGEPYRSAALHNEYDCKARTVRLIEVAEYVAPLAKGDLLRSYPAEDSQPRPISPGSVSSAIFDQVCAPPLPGSKKIENTTF